MREILIADPETGLPKRLDGTVPEWATERMEFVKRFCRERGWPEDLNQLTLDQVLEIPKGVRDAGSS